MRATIELSDLTYARLKQMASYRGVRDLSIIVEEALEHFFESADRVDPVPGLAGAEGTWSQGDVDEWECARRDAWGTWPASQSRDFE